MLDVVSRSSSGLCTCAHCAILILNWELRFDTDVSAY